MERNQNDSEFKKKESELILLQCPFKEQKEGGAILFLIAPDSLGIHVVGQEFRNFPHWVVK